MLRTVQIHQEWNTPLSAEDAWKTIVGAFTDSARSQVWPHRFSEIRSLSAPLKKGSQLEVRYKLGPLKTRTHYRVAQFDSPRTLRYEAGPDHPLRGGAEISVIESPGGSKIKWSGSYQAKGPLSALSLVWLKKVYEPRFFREIAKNFEELDGA